MFSVSHLMIVVGAVFVSGIAHAGVTVVSAERRVGIAGTIAGTCTLSCADIVSNSSGGFAWSRNAGGCGCSMFGVQALVESNQNSQIGGNGVWFGNGFQNNNLSFTSDPSTTLSTTDGRCYLTVTFTTSERRQSTLTTQIAGRNSFVYGSGAAEASMTLSDSNGVIHSHAWPSADPDQKVTCVQLYPGESYTFTCIADASAISANGGQSRTDWGFVFSQFVECKPDFNADCIVDFFDYLDFNAAYSINDPSADYNSDSVIDFFDYLDFVADFSAGCS